MTDLRYLRRRDVGVVAFTGPQVVATLNGILTNDVAALHAGEAQPSAALTAKGKVVAVVQLVLAPDAHLAVVDAAALPGFMAMLKKFVNPRFATARDVTDARAVFQVVGGAPPSIPGAVVATSAQLGVPSSLVVIAAGDAAATDALLSGAATQVDAVAFESLRVEAGWPRWAADVDESHLAQEAGLDRLGAISFNKGCYTGQETVARVHFRGHVNRTLRGLRLEGAAAPGAALHRADGEPAGEVRSVAQSARFGAIALAYVRREVADGDPVRIGDEPNAVRATVVPLPFG